MKRQQLGRSGLTVSPLIIGGNSWGAAGRRDWAGFGDKESNALIGEALDLGLNSFDTAEMYNEGESERLLGAYLKSEGKRDQVTLISKIGYPTSAEDGLATLSRNELLRRLDQSLKRLQTDYLDLFIVHRLDEITPIEELVLTLDLIVRSGRARYIGCSSMPAWRFAQILTKAEHMAPLARPVAMQNLYNLAQRDEERDMIPLCLEAGVGLTPYSPLARGALAQSASTPDASGSERAQHDQRRHAVEDRLPPALRDCLARIAEEKNSTPAAVAIAWVIAQEVVSAPVVGVTKPGQLQGLIEGATLVLSQEELDALSGASPGPALPTFA